MLILIFAEWDLTNYLPWHQVTQSWQRIFAAATAATAAAAKSRIDPGISSSI